MALGLSTSLECRVPYSLWGDLEWLEWQRMGEMALENAQGHQPHRLGSPNECELEGWASALAASASVSFGGESAHPALPHRAAQGAQAAAVP